MGLIVVLDPAGSGQVTFEHWKGTAALDNGLSVVSPVPELLATSSTSTHQFWTRSYTPGTEVIVRLLYNGAYPGDSAYNSTGARASVITNTSTEILISWEDSGDNDFDDAFTRITGEFNCVSLGGRYENISPPTIAQVFFQPVLFEAVNHLTGTYLDDGRGILVWCSGSSVRYGFVDSPRQWASNGSCTAGFTAVDAATLGSNALTASTFRVGTDLFILVNGATSGTTGYDTKVFKANSASNPTSWTLHGTLASQNVNVDLTYAFDGQMCGIPWVNGSTWVVMAPAYLEFLTPSWFPQNALWRSTDGGVTWTRLFVQGFGSFQITSNIGGSTGIARDVSTGHLWWQNSGSGSGSNPPTDNRYWRSTDNGITWTQIFAINVSDSNMPLFDNGVDTYGIRRRHGSGQLYQYIKFNDLAGDPTDVELLHDFTMSEWPRYIHLCADSCGSTRTLYLFNGDRVWLTAQGGWQVGSVALG